MPRASGYDAKRAAAHDWWVECLAKKLETRGYAVQICDVDGYEPDLITEDGYRIDVKIAKPENGRLAIAADEFEWQCTQYGERMFYAVVCRGGKVRYLTAVELRSRMIGGRRPPTENGSNTDWFLFDVET